MMRWQEPMDNIYHLTDRINKKDRVFIQYADLNDYTSMYNLIEAKRPKFIFHLAAQSFPRTSFDIPIETLQTNIIGTANLLECIKKQNNKMVMILLFMFVLLVKFMVEQK
jgi:GDPmannose 4,6-dehydratase